jgi:hypothetical protein
MGDDSKVEREQHKGPSPVPCYDETALAKYAAYLRQNTKQRAQRKHRGPIPRARAMLFLALRHGIMPLKI